MIKLETYLFLSIKCTARIVGRLAAGKIGHECEIRENVTGLFCAMILPLFNKFEASKSQCVKSFSAELSRRTFDSKNADFSDVCCKRLRYFIF